MNGHSFVYSVNIVHTIDRAKLNSGAFFINQIHIRVSIRVELAGSNRWRPTGECSNRSVYSIVSISVSRTRSCLITLSIEFSITNLISCVSVLVLLNAAKTALGLISSRFPFEAGSNERIVRRQGIVISTMRKIDFTSSIA